MVPAARRLRAVLLLSVAVLAPSAKAASTIPEIVVTPNYTPTPLDRVGSTVTVIDGGKIARASPASAAQLLRTVPGVTVIESGGPGGSAEVRLRGAETGHTVVLIDGVRVNDPATARGDFDFVMLSLGDVERIEVLRGPQSAVYGSDAMGGVINIITRKQKAKKSLTATVEGGSYGTLSEHAAGGMTAGDFSLRFSGAHFFSEGFSRRGNRDTNEADGAEKTSGSVRLTYAPADGPSFDAGVTATREMSEYDGAAAVTGPNALNTVTRTQVSGFAKMALPTWDSWLDQSVTTFFTTSARENLEPGAAPPVANYASSNFGAEYQAVMDFASAGTLTIGARAEFEHARNLSQTVVSFPGFDGERTYFAGYAQHELTLFDNLHFTFSGRYDGQVDGEGFLTGRATAAYDLPDRGTRFRASIGTGAKRPTAYQVGDNLFAASIAPIGVTVPTDLKTEKSIGVDAGIEQTLFAGAVHVSATVFYNRFTNLLGFTFFPGSFVNGYYDNTDLAETSGLEFALDTQIWPDVLSANATYTWMPTRNLVTGKPLPRRPEHSGSFSVTFSPDRRFETTLTGIVVGPRTNLASSATMMPGWWRLDLAASYALTDSTKLFGRVENLTDNRYQDPDKFNTPGFSAYVGLTWNN